MATDPQYDKVLPANKAGDKHGCYNRQIDVRKQFYWATNRNYFPDGSFDLVSVRIPVRASTKCRSFYLWDTDPMCAGCSTPKDVDYQQRMVGTLK